MSKLQTLQNRVARVVMGIKYDEADHDLLLTSLGWMNVNNLYIMTLPSSCTKLQMELHQNTNSLCLINAMPFIHRKQDQQETKILLLLQCQFSKGQTAFVYSGAQDGRSLEARSISIFQERLKKNIFS